MESFSEEQKPIIIRRVVKKGAHGHGGAWKVAFADFATAMMAFFLLLWIMGNTTPEQKEAISGYFVDPQGSTETPGAYNVPIGEGGVDAGVIDMEAPKIKEVETAEEIPEPEINEATLDELLEQREREQLEVLKKKVEALVENNAAFAQYKDQVLIDITPSGLRIQIVDRDKRPMFDSGSAELKFYSRKILYSLASVLSDVPNKLSITGHTDAMPYDDRDNYGNWELSSDRANAARRALVRGGILVTQVARVEGFADSVLYDVSNPVNSINRRIAIIVLKQSIADAITEEAAGQQK